MYDDDEVAPLLPSSLSLSLSFSIWEVQIRSWVLDAW
jgi:hypothetical protein